MRYLVFSFETYYPFGGWDDFQGAFASREEAMDYIAGDESYHEHYQIVDTVLREVVWSR